MRLNSLTAGENDNEALQVTGAKIKPGVGNALAEQTGLYYPGVFGAPVDVTQMMAQSQLQKTEQGKPIPAHLNQPDER